MNFLGRIRNFSKRPFLNLLRHRNSSHSCKILLSVYMVHQYRRSIYSRCDTSQISLSIPPTIIIVKERKSLLYNLLNGFSDFFAILFRSIYLCFLFSPSVLASPLLLSNQLQSIWWHITRYCICLGMKEWNLNALFNLTSKVDLAWLSLGKLTYTIHKTLTFAIIIFNWWFYK